MDRSIFYASALLLFVCQLSYGVPVPDEAIPLSKEQTAELLGSAKLSSLVWRKLAPADYIVYFGCNPTGAIVGIHLGSSPGIIPDSSLPKVDGRLGMYLVRWQKRVRPDHVALFETVISFQRPFGSASVWIETKDRNEFDKLAEEISKFPLFNQPPRPGGAP